MKILVTGSSGFLGSWICRVLSEEYEVLALVRDTSNLSKLSDLQNLTIIQLKASDWVDFILESAPDVLILNHWSGVSNENRNDAKQFANVDSIRNLAKAALNGGVKTIIGVGSQAELGPIDSRISENAVDNPTSIYGQAKVSARLQLDHMTQCLDSRFVWMRIFSTYGPLDDGSWLIPNIVDALKENSSVSLTKGEQQWSYLHAYDLALAFRTVIANIGISGIVNVGNPETISIYEVASIIGEILDKRQLLKFGELDYRPDQVMRLQPLCEKLTSAGWQPQIGFMDGIKQTIDWLQGNQLQPLETKEGKSLNLRIPSRQ